MSSWLTFVVGIILGLLIGWLIDLLYRGRADQSAGQEPVESQARPPAWAAPLPEAAERAQATMPPEETPVEEPDGQPESVEAAVLAEGSGAPEEPAEPDAAPPAEPLVEAEPLPAPQPPAPVAAAATAAAVSQSRDVPEVPVETEAPAAAAPSGSLAGEVSHEPEWPEVAARVDEAEVTPAAERHIAAELPAESEGLPPEAVDALAPAAVAAEAAGQVAPPAGARDKLIVIEGIGPAYEARLFAGGINTFQQLAESTPERLREIIQPQGWQRLNFAEWIEQARLIVEGKDEELKALQAQLFSRKK